MENKIESLEKEIEIIKGRNLKVETDKAWEISNSRIAFVLVTTYFLTSLVFYFIGVQSYFQSALIPTIGYFLSTQSLPFIKKWWVKNIYKK